MKTNWNHNIWPNILSIHFFEITRFSTFLLIATMLSTRVVILLLCITLTPVNLTRRRHYLIETEDEEGNELSKINSTFPDGPSKSNNNRAQSARINQHGDGDKYGNIVQGTGSGGCSCTFKGKPCFRGGSGGMKILLYLYKIYVVRRIL